MIVWNVWLNDKIVRYFDTLDDALDWLYGVEGGREWAADAVVLPQRLDPPVRDDWDA